MPWKERNFKIKHKCTLLETYTVWYHWSTKLTKVYALHNSFNLVGLIYLMLSLKVRVKSIKLQLTWTKCLQFCFRILWVHFTAASHYSFELLKSENEINTGLVYIFYWEILLNRGKTKQLQSLFNTEWQLYVLKCIHVNMFYIDRNHYRKSILLRHLHWHQKEG